MINLLFDGQGSIDFCYDLGIVPAQASPVKKKLNFKNRGFFLRHFMLCYKIGVLSGGFVLIRDSASRRSEFRSASAARKEDRRNEENLGIF